MATDHFHRWYLRPSSGNFWVRWKTTMTSPFSLAGSVAMTTASPPTSCCSQSRRFCLTTVTTKILSCARKRRGNGGRRLSGCRSFYAKLRIKFCPRTKGKSISCQVSFILCHYCVMWKFWRTPNKLSFSLCCNLSMATVTRIFLSKTIAIIENNELTFIASFMEGCSKLISVLTEFINSGLARCLFLIKTLILHLSSPYGKVTFGSETHLILLTIVVSTQSRMRPIGRQKMSGYRLARDLDYFPTIILHFWVELDCKWLKWRQWVPESVD